MTNAIPWKFVIGRSSFIVFRSAKFWQKSDAARALPAIASELHVLTQGPPERPCAENVSPLVFPSCTCQFSSGILFLKLRRQLRRNSLRRWFPRRRVG